jgi:hypothetical protein
LGHVFSIFLGATKRFDPIFGLLLEKQKHSKPYKQGLCEAKGIVNTASACYPLAYPFFVPRDENFQTTRLSSVATSVTFLGF